MEWHKLLKRQLHHEGLSIDQMPNNIDQWHQFLSRINLSYVESDQERYLLERSMEISSREMNELNKQLERSQKIAGLGYWFYNRENETQVWSKEIYKMFDIDISNPPLPLEETLNKIHEQDREQLREFISKAFTQGLPYEIQVRVVDKNDKLHWYQVIGEPQAINGKTINQLSGVVLDITRHKQYEAELEKLHKELMLSAHRAGMADVAASILHNVGNILNSANVSTELMKEHLKSSHYKKLFTIIQMIHDNKGNLAKFFSDDEKGKLIPEYLVELSSHLMDNYKSMLNEVENIYIDIKSIKEFTEMQKSLSQFTSENEQINITELIDDALKMCGQNIKTNHIKVNKNYGNNINIYTDRVKLLQIMVNLLQNAKDALLSNKNDGEKIINIDVKSIASNMLEIIISDNGVGIHPENLTKIFSYGYTTKSNGHGYGLHSSAIAAKGLGGELLVSSNGPEKGAEFILKLPTKHTEKEYSYDENIGK